MTASGELYNTYRDTLQKAADLNNAAALLAWDQETYMPPKGAEARGRQLASLAGLAHEMLTSGALGTILDELAKRADLDEIQQANIRLSREDYAKSKMLPAPFVEKLAAAASSAFGAWIEAREKSDFSVFLPELAKTIALKREQAALYGDAAHPYDTLLDDYEKGMTVAILDPVFEEIASAFPPILEAIAVAPQVRDDFFTGNFPKERQWAFSLDVLRAMGYDFEAGRQDYSEHPFTTSFASTDVRITTRATEADLSSMLWSSIHEGGHALYEQGLPASQYGLPLGEAASLSIHESQSRLWENMVGRGPHFWTAFYPRIRERFPEALGGIEAGTFYRAANKVQPSMIRTEADELTYHYHVMIRYRIEKAVIAGSLEAADIPAQWNALYRQYLGVAPANDVEGVLQDVHWSHGSFGYFPTYSLGSFYAAQFYAQAVQEIPDLEEAIAAGRFGSLLTWLREKVHIHGRRFRSEMLCNNITGRGLDINVFLNYTRGKYGSIYNLPVP